MSQHTKEPWRHQRYKIESSLIVSCADASRIIAEVKFEDDARRIVAAVNACQHYSTEDLEEVGEHLSGVLVDTRKRCAELIAQRDELLAVLKMVVKYFGQTQIVNQELKTAIAGANFAIAKAVQP